MLPTYKSILVATDLTRNSENAFKHALTVARQSSAKIYLLHVVPEVDSSFRSYVSAVVGADKLASLEKKHEKDALEELKEELEQFAKDELEGSPEDLKLFAGAIVLHGHIVPQILESADEINADLIVVGTHGKGILEHTFLGSTAENLLRRSKRPVFVVPLP